MRFLGLAAPACSCAWTASQSSGAMIDGCWPLVDTPLVSDAAGVERIGQQAVEVSATER